MRRTRSAVPSAAARADRRQAAVPASRSRRRAYRSSRRGARGTRRRARAATRHRSRRLRRHVLEVVPSWKTGNEEQVRRRSAGGLDRGRSRSSRRRSACNAASPLLHAALARDAAIIPQRLRGPLASARRGGSPRSPDGSAYAAHAPADLRSMLALAIVHPADVRSDHSDRGGRIVPARLLPTGRTSAVGRRPRVRPSEVRRAIRRDRREWSPACAPMSRRTSTWRARRARNRLPQDCHGNSTAAPRPTPALENVERLAWA